MTPATYPAARRVDHVDVYHGVPVADPYHWMEDPADGALAPWIKAQNAVTAAYLCRLPARDELRRRFDELLSYPRYYGFLRRGCYLFFKKNDSLQDQLTLYAQRGLLGTPVPLLDPTALADNGLTKLTVFAPSREARYVAYGLSTGGAGWEEYRVLDLDTGRTLPDRLRWVKVSYIAWSGDGFYYSRFATPTEGEGSLTAPLHSHQVWYHQVSTAQSADVLAYEDREHPLRLHTVQTTEDERYAVLTIWDPSTRHPGFAVSVLDTGHSGAFVPAVASFDDRYRLVDSDGHRLFFLTDRGAPKGHVMMLDPAHSGRPAWTEVLPEIGRPIHDVVAIGGKWFVSHRDHGAHRLGVWDRAGRFENDVLLPGIGTVQVHPGQRDDLEALWSFASFTTPPTVYRYDIASHSTSVFLKPEMTFREEDYRTTQVFVRSKDDTPIPMFIVHRDGIELDGRNACLLYGYGGNGVPVGPAFDPLVIALLERGVVYAVACLRGGGEYGEAWHRAGCREHKVNVFEDCIAAGQWLQANGYTSHDRAGLIGASNGGLLVGAVMTQRPDLFRVALPGAGVMDMLRFQHFTMGWSFAVEYGSSDDPEMFPTLLSYSPIHNVRKGVRYPATMVTTYQDDDCVVPAHSFKFIATLQERGAGPSPYLIRVGNNCGHGAASLPQELDERADRYAFLLANAESERGSIAVTSWPSSEGPTVS